MESSRACLLPTFPHARAETEASLAGLGVAFYTEGYEIHRQC